MYVNSEQRTREASPGGRPCLTTSMICCMMTNIRTTSFAISPGPWEENRECLTRLEGKEDMLNEGQNPIVLHVPWLAEGLLQLFLHILLWIKEIDLGFLEAKEGKRTSCGWKWEYMLNSSVYSWSWTARVWTEWVPYMWCFFNTYSPINIHSLPYFLNNIFFSLVYFIIRVQYILHVTQNVC